MIRGTPVQKLYGCGFLDAQQMTYDFQDSFDEEFSQQMRRFREKKTHSRFDWVQQCKYLEGTIQRKNEWIRELRRQLCILFDAVQQKEGMINNLKSYLQHALAQTHGFGKQSSVFDSGDDSKVSVLRTSKSLNSKRSPVKQVPKFLQAQTQSNAQNNMSTMSFMPLETLPLTKITQSALLRGQNLAKIQETPTKKIGESAKVSESTQSKTLPTPASAVTLNEFSQTTGSTFYAPQATTGKSKASPVKNVALEASFSADELETILQRVNQQQNYSLHAMKVHPLSQASELPILNQNSVRSGGNVSESFGSHKSTNSRRRVATEHEDQQQPAQLEPLVLLPGQLNENHLLSKTLSAMRFQHMSKVAEPGKMIPSQSNQTLIKSQESSFSNNFSMSGQVFSHPPLRQYLASSFNLQKTNTLLVDALQNKQNFLQQDA